MSVGERQWVLTAYLLAFGGLLLFGGRLADIVGRRRIFVIGVIGFVVASVVGGLAQTSTMLIAARAMQGVGAALMAPAGLSLISAAFPNTAERTKALGIFGAIAGSGAAVGFIAGGVFTEYLDWRWALLVNVPIGLLATAGAFYAVRDTTARVKRRLDLAGAVLVSTALMALILGFSEAERSGWAGAPTIALLG